MKKSNGHFRCLFGLRPTLWIGMLLTLVFYTNCCNSDSSVKRLNESSAKKLIQEHTSNLSFKIPLNSYLPLLDRTLKDRSAPTGTTLQDSIFQHLIEQGFVLQKADIIQYPVISGVFSGALSFDKREFKLEMVANSNNLVGEATEVYADTPAVSHKVTGTVDPDGTVQLSDNYVGVKAVYREQGSTAHFDRLDCQGIAGIGPCSYVGKASGRKLDIKWYTYSWSPEFQQKIVRNNNVYAVIGGGFDIGEVSDLRLITETEATAYATYTGVLDKIGKSFYPASPPNGRWQVLFGKKPDGTWFIDQLR